MKPLNSLYGRFAALFQRSRINAEMEEELRSHIQHRADDLERSGISRAEAERRARIEFGGYQRYKEESHEALGNNFFETLAQDIRFSLRVLRKSPGFTVAAVLTLALAIGANAVVFSIMNAFLIRPLNVPHPDSLYAIFHQPDNDAHESYPDYRDLRERSSRSFDSVMAYNVGQVGLDTGANPSQVWIEEASENYFDALGLQPYLGRFFHDSDDHGANSAPFIVLTYAFWQSHFQADRGVVGRVVQLNRHPFTIIGVAQPEFHGTLLFFNPDFFTPLVDDPELGGDGLDKRGHRWIFMVMGHLKPGVTQTQAIADLNLTGSYLERTYPKDEPKMTFTLGRPSLYGDYVGRPAREFLTGLMLLAGLILLAACANLGSLFAARAADRSREVALRLALGSSRRRILRGLFTEAILIALAGGAVGLLGSVALLHGLSAWRPISRWPLQLSVNPDAKVYAVALLLALVSGILFGAVPIRQVLRTNPYEVVKAGSGGIIAGNSRRLTLRDVLLVVQIAICAVLVTASMVAVRGLARSLHKDFGFDVQNTMLVSTDLGMAGYSGDRVGPMQKRLMEALETIPGVQSVGLADTVPLGDGGTDSNVFTDDASDLTPSNAVEDPVIYKVSPEYFQAAGTVLLSGRMFTSHDDKNSPRVAIVNRSFAKKVLGSAANAVGRSFKMPDGTRIQVIGIAEDGKYTSLTEDSLPAMFFPILQSPTPSTCLVVRSKSDPQQLETALRATLRQMDSGLPVYIETRYKGLDAMLFGPRMATLALGVLGVMGAMLSITGIFGMAAYSVSKRLRELGIRMALGAQRKEVLQAALGRPLKLLVFGSVAGLVLGILASRVLAFIVSQATPRDPLVLAGVVLAMSLLGLLATWIPAHRALSVNPLILLREE
jgi:predicted permease